MMPPTAWLQAVAAAAPTSPHWNRATNRASSTMFAMPAAMVTASPSCGFWAVTKKLWNSYCRIKAGRAARIMRPYRTQLSSSSPSAPIRDATGLRKRMPRREITTLPAADTYTSMEKIRFAFSLSPVPMVMAIRALPPVPNINPTAPRIIRKGMIKFTAAKGVFPTKFDTKKPSTTP